MAAQDEGLRRTEAKAYFANERTFLHWLNVSVTVGSIAAAMLGVSGHVHKNWGSDFSRNAVAARVVALAMMLTSIGVAAYAAFIFAYRCSLLKFKLDSGYDNRLLPVVLTVVLTVVLVSIFLGAVDTFEASSHTPP